MRPSIYAKVRAYTTHLDILDTNTDADEAWVSARVGVDALLDERLDAAETGCGLKECVCVRCGSSDREGGTYDEVLDGVRQERRVYLLRRLNSKVWVSTGFPLKGQF